LPKAEAAAREAIRIDPDLPDAQLAVGAIQYNAEEFGAALESFKKVHRRWPSNMDAVMFIGVTLRRQGKMEEALTYLGRLREHDPRSNLVHFDYLGNTYFWLRQYDLAERHYDRAITLSPDVPLVYLLKAQTILNRDGDINGAERTLRTALRKGNVGDLAEYLGWGPSRTQIRLMPQLYSRLLDQLDHSGPYMNSPGDTVFLYLAKAELNFRFDREQIARSYCDSVVVYLETQLPRMAHTIWGPHLYKALGLAYSGLGLCDQAIQAGEQGARMCPVSRDALFAQILLHELAEIYVRCGEYDKAIEQLEYLLSISSGLSVTALEIDPVWDPLRDHPRYPRLLGEYSGGTP
jgi:serine/threonine-protein kinase